MFGSTLHGIGHDIDILIVGSSGKLLSVLKHEMRVAGDKLPLDVLYMLPSEEAETDFINKEKCVKLLDLASMNTNVINSTSRHNLTF